MTRKSCLTRTGNLRHQEAELKLSCSASIFKRGVYCAGMLAVCIATMQAQDRPYFVSYSHDMEDPGEAEIESKMALAGSTSPFGAMASEFEIGLRSWWTAGFYLDGQVTDEDSAIYTGFRFENRLRPLKGEHAINPVLYFEYESISGADKTLLEIAGHDGESDLDVPNATGRRTHQHEGELRLILSSDAGSWNFAENFIAEKNLGHAPWEFGYAAAVSRPLRAPSGNTCTLCRESIVAGVELYGGAGDTRALTLRDTSHYVAPVIGWNLCKQTRINLSPSFGITSTSKSSIYRIGFVYEFQHLPGRFHDAD